MEIMSLEKWNELKAYLEESFTEEQIENYRKNHIIVFGVSDYKLIRKINKKKVNKLNRRRFI